MLIKIKNFIFKYYLILLGLLEVTNISETVLLSGIHTHVVVVYAIQDNNKIVIGYLTSDKSKDLSVKLSDTQPFNSDNINNKEQRLALLREPLLIVKGEHLQDLSNCKLGGGTMVNQQQIGHDYITQKEIHNVLQEQFKSKVIPKIQKGNGYIDVYNGKGITIEDIDHVLKQVDLEREAHIKELFNQYKLKKNLQNTEKLEGWLKKKQNVLDIKTFEELKKYIEKYESKFK